jgi:NADPH:quinone reductase-like Zn-dependent oxidoreductase
LRNPPAEILASGPIYIEILTYTTRHKHIKRRTRPIMSSNAASWLPKPKSDSMSVDVADSPTARDNEIVVKVEAIALNPMDWMIQTMGPDLFGFIKYPYIGGTDVAGEITQVGKGVPPGRFAPGDRVLGLTLGLTTNDPRDGGFQQYAVLQSHMASPVPKDISALDAAVLPLGIATAAAGLYQKDYLGLSYPSTNPKTNGKTVLIWAGSSSVGSNAIQLAKASGYEVITTSSPKNFAFCKSLGATLVFDYSSATLTQDLVNAFSDRVCGGAFAILPGSVEPCIEVVHRSKGAKFIAMALPYDGKLPEGIETKFVFATTIKDNEVSKVIFEDYLPQALLQHQYQCSPRPSVVGHGLESLQEGVNRLKEGVSASKLVVTL